MGKIAIIERAMNEGKGVVRLAPAWVPRSFCRPGRRLRLHPDDYFSLGLARGGIDERWFASTTPADNGPGTPEDEGLSYLVTSDGKERALLLDAVNDLGSQIIGDTLYKKYGRWPMFSKFFDNKGPLPHHVHHNEEFAARVNSSGKPEMYFFPAQYNNYGAEFPFTFFGINPGVSKEEVKKALMDFSKGDNKLLELSRAYKISVDTGWDVPPGILHAPASMCTYEPQFASDVYAMYQSILYFDHAVPNELLWKNTPPENVGDFDYLMEVLDWEGNIDPHFYQNRFMRPIAINKDSTEEGYLDEWICYRCAVAGAKRMTLDPGCSVVIKEKVPYGLLCVEGFGTIGNEELSAPTMIRYGQLTCDEYFVTESAAKEGVKFINLSTTEPMVILRHFSEHPDRPVL